MFMCLSSTVHRVPEQGVLTVPFSSLNWRMSVLNVDSGAVTIWTKEQPDKIPK